MVSRDPPGEPQVRAAPFPGDDDRFRAIFDHAAAGIGFADVSGRILRVNKACCETLGYTEEELVGISFLTLTHRDDRDRNKALVDRMLAGKIPHFVIEKRMIRKDGGERWVRSSLSLIRDAAGRPVNLVVVLEDITAHRQAEERLRESERRERARAAELAAVLEAVPAIVFVAHDPDCRVITGSRATHELLRLPPGSNLSKSAATAATSHFKVLKDGVELPPEALPLQRAARGAELRGHEEQVVFADGTARHLYGHAIPLRDEDGTVRGAVGAFLDVTERKRAEGALRAGEEHYRAIVEDQTELVCRFRPDTTLLFVNAACAARLGGTPQSLLGRRLLDVMRPERCAAFLAHLSSLTPSAPVAREEWRWELSSGEIRWYIWTTRAFFDASGRPIEFQGVGTDITVLKRTEASLRQAKDEAEVANRSKSRFLAAASHDLRQPLQTIGALLGSLARLVTDEAGRRSLAGLRDAHASMRALLDTLLDINRLEKGVTTPRWATVPVAEVLEALRGEFTPLARAKGLDFRIVCSRRCIRSDHGLLQQILRNLVSNAIKYTSGGTVLVGCRRRGETLRLEVWDTGIGISGEHLDRLFEEFYQVDNQARRREEGLGLGLAIAKRLADLLGHALQVRSVPGWGSVFAIEVPVAAADPRAATRSERVEAARGPIGLPVLLIEDDPAVLDSLSILLRLEGFSVLAAMSGAEALERLSEGAPPAVVVADYRLPGETGLEAIERVREHAGRKLPCIVLTGDVSQQHAREIERAGCILLHKPADPGELVGAILQCAWPARS